MVLEEFEAWLLANPKFGYTKSRFGLVESISTWLGKECEWIKNEIRTVDHHYCTLLMFHYRCYHKDFARRRAFVSHIARVEKFYHDLYDIGYGLLVLALSFPNRPTSITIIRKSNLFRVRRTFRSLGTRATNSRPHVSLRYLTHAMSYSIS